MKILLLITAMCLSNTAIAQSVVASHAIRAKSIITRADLAIVPEITIGAVQSVDIVIGQEARVNIYPGRPIQLADIGPPAIMERNQIVVMVYNLGGLSITAEGRILDRAGVGERVRVMNMDSRVTVMGTVMPNGTIEVGS